MLIVDLQQSASSPIWDDEETIGTYVFPVQYGDEITAKEPALSAGIQKNELYRVGEFLAAKSPESHIGPFKWAIDLLVPDCMEVLAAEDGTVIEVREDSSEWGDGSEFRDKLNYLTIQHANGEFSQYCHLAQYSVRERHLQIGSKVKKLQPLAIVGKTGWTDRDHLHFIVFRKDSNPQNPFGFKSLKVRFTGGM